MQRIGRRQETRTRPPRSHPRHDRRRKRQLGADNKRRIRARGRPQDLLDPSHPTPTSHKRNNRGNERRARKHRHGQAPQLQATRNPVLHRRSLMIARIPRRNKPHRANQRNQHAANSARPPVRMSARRTREQPGRQKKTGHSKQRRTARETSRIAQQEAHKDDQQRARQRRDRTVMHSPNHRRTANDSRPQVATQAERVARRRIIHPRIRAQRQIGDHRAHRDERPAREGCLNTRDHSACPPLRDSNTDRRPIRHVRGRSPPGSGYFSDALAHRPIVSESARGRDAARRPRADSCCDVSARESLERSAPSVKECGPRARPRPRAPPPSRQPCPTNRTRSHPRGPSSYPQAR